MKSIVSKLLLGLFLIASPFAYGGTWVFTGGSDAVQFPSTLPSLTPGFEGTIVTGADTITFNGGGNDGNTPVHYVADLPGDLPGSGDFVYTTTLAMSDRDDFGGWWEHGIRVTFADDSVTTLLWGNYGDDGSFAFAGADHKCVTVTTLHICEDADPVLGSGDIMLRLELSGTTLTASYSSDGMTWTVADSATLDAGAAAGWTLSTMTYGLDNVTFASISAVVDEIRVTTPSQSATVTFTGSSDAVQFPSTLPSLTPGFEGTIVTGADTITFNGGGNDGNTPVHYVADLPGDLPGSGDFVYTTTLAMSDRDDFGGWWEHGIRVTFADDSVTTLLWGNYGDDGSFAFAGADHKCVTVTTLHICEDADPVLGSGDIMLRLELSGTTLTASYSSDGMMWTVADSATLDAGAAAGWTLSTMTYGLDNVTFASISAVVDEISVTTPVAPTSTVTFTGSSDAVQFPSTLPSLTPGFEGSIVTGADTITFNGGGNDGNTPVFYVADLPGDLPGSGDFVYTTTLAMSDRDDFGGWWEHGIRVTFADDSVTTLLWGNYGDDGSFAFAGGDHKCVTVTTLHVCEDADPVLGSGDIMLKLELSGTTLTASYSSDGMTWTVADSATLDAGAAAGWSLSTMTYGLDNVTFAAISAVVDEISVTTPVATTAMITFTGSSDAVQFPATYPSLTPGFEGTIVTGADTITFNGGGSDGSTIVYYVADLPGDLPGAGDFVYTTTLAMSDRDDFGGWWEHGMRVTLADDSVVTLLWGNYGDDGSFAFTGADNKCITVTTLHICEDADPVLGSGDIMLRLELSGTTLTASYSADGTTWTVADSQTLDAAVAARWTLSTMSHGLDNVTFAPISATVDEITVTYTPSAADVRRPVITIIGMDPAEIVQGGSYVDAGAMAEDDVDGDITANIVTVSNVDESTLGTYTVTYTVSDAAGNMDEETRTVTVFADEPPVITLIGDAAVDVIHNSTYIEEGATATDYVEGDVPVTIGGDEVDTTAVDHVFNVTYDASDSAGLAATQVTRAVTVVPDMASVIDLNDAAGSYLLVGETYTELGATAADDLDGDVSANIVIGGDVVDPATPGRYVVTYTVTDSVGNTSEKTRTIKVVEELPPAGLSVAALFTGAADEIKFPETSDGGPITYQEDTITFMTLGQHPDTFAEQIVEVDLPEGTGNGAGNFEYTVKLAMSNYDDLTGWVYEGLVARFGDAKVQIRWEQSIVWPNQEYHKYVRVYSYADDTPADPAFEAADLQDEGFTGDLSLRIALVDGILTASYSQDGVDWIEAYTLDMSTTEVSPTTAWSLGLVGYGMGFDLLDNHLDESFGFGWITGTKNRIDEITLKLPPGPVISLTGGSTVAMELFGPEYTDPGATAEDDLFGDISDLVVISGDDAVDIDTVGTYEVNYDVTNPNGLRGTRKTRAVNVSSRPVITLVGPEEITIIPGTRYWQRERDIDNNNVLLGDCNEDIDVENENGCFWDDVYDDGSGNWTDVTVWDAEDGDMTTRVVVEDAIVWTENPSRRADVAPGEPNDLDMFNNTGWVGQYLITYNFTDSSGLAAVEVTRTINVEEPDLPPIARVDGGGGGGCFIDTASPTSSNTMLTFLAGLILLCLAGCVVQEARKSKG
jgi:hypothetical protein